MQPPLGPEAKQELDAWLEKNDETIPAVVKDAFSHYNLLLEGLAGNQAHLKSALLQLRRALGIEASSEKRKNSGDPIGGSSEPGDPKPKDPAAKIRCALERALRLIKWHKDLLKKNKRMAKGLENKLVDLEPVECTPEELAEIDVECAERLLRLGLGDGPQPAFESPKQAFMRGGDVRVEENFVVAEVDPSLLVGEKVVSRIADERIRYDFNLTVTKINVEVEKVVIKDAEGSTRIISASTRDIGPPRMDVTWDFLANVAIMVSQYGMPFNRLGGLLTVPEKRFSSASLTRMFFYVAERFVPIYLHNFSVLSNSQLLSGDDTTTRVLEYARYMKACQSNPQSAGLSPWASYATSEAAEVTFKETMPSSLGVLLARELGFEFDRKDGNGQKKSLQTSVISGRGEDENPRSTIIFYRSHIGGFGNLLTRCLTTRKPEFQKLIVQADLATVNLITDPALAARFIIELAGCASHARRPFALYENDDPQLCSIILHIFKGLYIDEKELDFYGRNETNVRAVRNIDSRALWEEIQNVARIISLKWSKATKLGGAAHYILRHYQKLTAYLDNPLISISNDFSERMLRMEKLIQANALFRNSLEGRFALDINRTSLQTAIAAQVPLQEYVNYVLRASPEKVAANPEDYTALAYSRMHQNSPR